MGEVVLNFLVLREEDEERGKTRELGRYKERGRGERYKKMGEGKK